MSKTDPGVKKSFGSVFSNTRKKVPNEQIEKHHSKKDAEHTIKNLDEELGSIDSAWIEKRQKRSYYLKKSRADKFSRENLLALSGLLRYLPSDVVDSLSEKGKLDLLKNSIVKVAMAVQNNNDKNSFDRDSFITINALTRNKLIAALNKKVLTKEQQKLYTFEWRKYNDCYVVMLVGADDYKYSVSPPSPQKEKDVTNLFYSVLSQEQQNSFDLTCQYMTKKELSPINKNKHRVSSLLPVMAGINNKIIGKGCDFKTLVVKSTAINDWGPITRGKIARQAGGSALCFETEKYHDNYPLIVRCKMKLAKVASKVFVLGRRGAYKKIMRSAEIDLIHSGFRDALLYLTTSELESTKDDTIERGISIGAEVQIDKLLRNMSISDKEHGELLYKILQCKKYIAQSKLEDVDSLLGCVNYIEKQSALPEDMRKIIICDVRNTYKKQIDDNKKFVEEKPKNDSKIKTKKEKNSSLKEDFVFDPVISATIVEKVIGHKLSLAKEKELLESLEVCKKGITFNGIESADSIAKNVECIDRANLPPDIRAIMINSLRGALEKKVAIEQEKASLLSVDNNKKENSSLQKNSNYAAKELQNTTTEKNITNTLQQIENTLQQDNKLLDNKPPGRGKEGNVEVGDTLKSAIDNKEKKESKNVDFGKKLFQGPKDVRDVAAEINDNKLPGSKLNNNVIGARDAGHDTTKSDTAALMPSLKGIYMKGCDASNKKTKANIDYKKHNLEKSGGGESKIPDHSNVKLREIYSSANKSKGLDVGRSR